MRTQRVWQCPRKNPLPGSLCTQTSQNRISQQDRPVPPPPQTPDSEPWELHKAQHGKQGSKKNQCQGFFLCCEDFQESRGGDRESFPSSHRCAGKVGRSGHRAQHDTVTSEGLDTTRKVGKIPRELTFGRGLLQSQGETQCGGGNRLPQVRICFWHLDTTSGSRAKWEDVGSPG